MLGYGVYVICLADIGAFYQMGIFYGIAYGLLGRLDRFPSASFFVDPRQKIVDLNDQEGEIRVVEILSPGIDHQRQQSAVNFRGAVVTSVIAFPLIPDHGF